MNLRMLVLATVLLGGRTYANDSEAGLDLLVLLDRSGSMAGRRVELLPALAADLMTYNAMANRVTHRLGVISFGSDARVELPLTPVGETNLRPLLARVAIETGGHTDVLAAFASAKRLFSALPDHAARRRAIVVITDGAPNVPGIEARDYAGRLQRFVAHELPRAALHIVLVRRGEERIWRELSSNRLHDASTDSAAATHRLITALVGTRTAEAVPENGPLVITLPPYLDFVVFDVFHGAEGGEVRLVPPGPSPPIEWVRLGDVMSTVAVNRPAAGAWTFHKAKPDARVRIFSQQFFPRGRLVRPAEPLRQHDRVAVAYQVVDRDGRPFREIAGHPLAVDLQMTTPAGKRIASPMTSHAALGLGTFAATETTCDVAGRYWTEVRIRSGDHELFRDRWSGFSVSAATLVDCRVTSRPPPSLLWSWQVDTAIDCNKRLDIPSAAEAFRASLRRNGQPVTGAVRFQSIGGGAFTGSLHGAAFPGSYTLSFIVDRTQLRGPYNVRIIPPETAFHREMTWLDGLLTAVLAIAAIGAWIHVARRPRRSA